MVFVCSGVSARGGMRTRLGFAFALSRLVARLGDRGVCRAEWSGLETHGVCLLVFGISYICAARLVPLFVRPVALQVMIFVVLPILLWVVFLLLFYLVSLAIKPFRRLGLYRAATNEPVQHLFFVFLTTLLSLSLLGSETVWLQSLGSLWLTLFGLNLIAIAIEKLLDRA